MLLKHCVTHQCSGPTQILWIKETNSENYKEVKFPWLGKYLK